MERDPGILNTLQELFDIIRKIVELGGLSEAELAGLRLLI
jgi:hypothetical protein